MKKEDVKIVGRKFMVFGVRKPAVAGSFYPKDKEELKELLKSFFKKVKKIQSATDIKALIVPHAGYIYSGQTVAWAYTQLVNEFNRKDEDKHFVLIGPSHYSSFSNLCVGTFDFWETPLGKVRQLPTQKAANLLLVDNYPHLPEHSLEVQLPFLQYLFKDFSISCFLTGKEVDYPKSSDFLLRNFSSSIFIISTDLSHYLSEVEARKKDKKTISAILSLDSGYFLKEDNVACGEKGVILLLQMAKIQGWRRRLIYADTSFSASGDSEEVVGYAAVIFFKD